MEFEIERDKKSTRSESDFRALEDSPGDGRDEMNLVEFPLSGITNRFLDGRKTVVFSDLVWDRDQHAHVKREIAISGSDRYGLPTAKDEDVLLACIQLSSLTDFRERQVHFSRYELLKLLRWPDEGKYYARLSTSLRRWKGVTVYSTRAFYDHARKSWVNRDFGIFDNLYVYERESLERATAPASSWLVWNEVLFDSFQSGYLKKLDWNLYCQLQDPVAKRLYRLLDKRFYHGDEVAFDLHDLAFRKVRISETSNTAQIKRGLANGIRELEAMWQIRPLPPERRFVKLEKGKWNVVFHRKKSRRLEPNPKEQIVAVAELELALARRGIGPAMANSLVSEHSAETIQTMIQLFDWYKERGQEKGPGFLVDSIRRAKEYQLPRCFTASRAPRARRAASVRRTTRTANTKPTSATCKVESERLLAFLEFWQTLTPCEQQAFEQEAVRQGDATKRDGYRRSQRVGGEVFEQYRQILMRDHFERTVS